MLGYSGRKCVCIIEALLILKEKKNHHYSILITKKIFAQMAVTRLRGDWQVPHIKRATEHSPLSRPRNFATAETC